MEQILRDLVKIDLALHGGKADKAPTNYEQTVIAAENEADPNGPLHRAAKEMRDTEVKKYLTDRYGEFVLLTPAFNGLNLALWAGPFLVVIAGAGLLVSRLRNRAPETDLSPEEADRVRALSQSDPT